MTDINAAGQNVVTAINNLNLKFQSAAFLKGYNLVNDRSHLNSSTIANSITRIYCRYYNSTNNAFNPDSPGPHVSGHWMRRQTISASGTNAQRLALTWGDAQTGQYFLQTDTSPNLVWWWLSNTPISNIGSVWLQAGHIGYAWDTSDNGTAYWQVDEINPNALQMGGLNSAVIGGSDDTLALTDLAYYFQMGRNVLVPDGLYTVSTAIPLATNGENVWAGEGGNNKTAGTFIQTTANINVIEINDFNGTGFKGNLRDFAVGAFGATGSGIFSNITSSFHNLLRDCEWSGVTAFGADHGMYIPAAYSCTLSNCQFGGYNGAGLALGGGPGMALIQCRGGSGGTLTAAYRISNYCSLYACNATFSDNGVGNNCAYAYHLGAYVSVTSTAAAGSSTNITLAAASTSVTDQIVGMDIVLTSGTGSGQTRRITAYSSATQVATVSSNWVTSPAAGTNYTIQDPISFMQLSSGSSNPTPVYTVTGCNAEVFTKNGLRTYGDTKLSVNGLTAPGKAGYEASIRIAPNNVNSSIVILNLSPVLPPPTAPSEIVSEGVLQWAPGYGGSYYNVATANVETYGVGQNSSVGGLPAASGVAVGSRSFVTDSNATTFHNTVASGGANKVPVVSDGTNWLIG